MFYTQSEQYDVIVSGHSGRPLDYPVLSDYPELLFYIQRNQNINTVIYELNMMQGDIINLNEPVKVSWINFQSDGSKTVNELNYIQKKLAFGHHFDVITTELIEFRFVAYDLLVFYLAKDDKGRFRIYTKFEDQKIVLKMIYIYAEDMGVFPQVKFAEFYGEIVDTKEYFYKKLILQ